MSILYLLIPLAVIFLVVAVAFFLWTVRNGQYDDLEGPAYRILMDDDDPMIPGNRPAPKQKGAAPDGPKGSDNASGRTTDEGKGPESRS